MASLFNLGFSAWRALYLYPTVPFAGALLAAFFYEYIYKKTQAFLAGEDESNDSDRQSDSMGEHDWAAENDDYQLSDKDW